jgi:hypothetical protein
MIAKQNIHKGNNFIGAFDYNDKKMSHEDPEKRAELLDHNFNKYNRELIAKEIQFLRQLRPNLTRDAYHVSLNFAQEDKLSKQDLIAIANDYMKGMGFNDNLYSLWQHHDADHCHAHLLIFRTRFDGSLVSDSNNFRRGEQLCRQLELKYNLQVVKSPKQAQERAPKKDELELFNRTGIPSNRMLMQVKVKMALENSGSLAEFIKNCQRENINLLFNQSETTGRVSGITYISSDGFIARGQALGNIFKWKNITDKLNYEQGRDNKTISEANRETRERFKDFLDKRNREPEIRNGKTVRTAGKHDGKSGGIRSENGSAFQKGDNGKHGANHSTSDRAGEPEQEDEKAVSHKFSTGASSIISGIGGLFGTTGAEEVDENANKRRRKAKR